MSPAAVDIRSPINSRQPKPAAIQNANINFASFPSDSGAQNQRSLNSSSQSFGNAGDFDVHSAFALPSGSRAGTAVPVRSRPRLVKVRKQSNGRSRTVSSENELGSNPFRSVSETPGQVNEGYNSSNGVFEGSNGISVSNGFDFANDDVGFVFGAKGSDIAQKLNYGETKFSGNVGSLNADDRGEIGIENATESRKFENVGFVFCAKPNDLQENFFSQKRQFCKNVEKSVSADMGKMRTECEIVFGANESDVGVKLNMVRGKSSESVVNLGRGVGVKMKSETKGANWNDLILDSNLNPEKGESSDNVEKRDSDDVGFVSGTNQSDLASTSNSEESKPSSVLGSSGLDFVFGASWFNSVPNLNLEQRESGESPGKLISDERKMKVESKTESPKVKATQVKFNTNQNGNWNEDQDRGVFIFGSNSEKSFSYSECIEVKCQDESKTNSKIFGNCNSIAKTENGNLDSDVNDKCKVVFESSSNVASSSSTHPVFKLPDVMKKLNINDCENVDGACRTKESNKNSCASAETAFVFSSSKKSSDCYSGSSGATSHDQIPEGHAAAFERSCGDNIKTSDENHTIVGNSCDLSNASVGIPGSEPCVSHAARLGKSADEGRLPKCQVNNGAQLNAAAVPSSFSPIGFVSLPNASIFEAPSTVEVDKKDESSSMCTSDGLGESFTDFSTAKWDPSCFKTPLFPDLNQKFEFSVKSRSTKGKRSKKIGGKLKQPSLHKLRHEQDHVPKESSSQEKPTSPGCYSPMDFSPYQETAAADQLSQGTYVTSNESCHPDNGCARSASHSTVTSDPKYENLATAEEGLYINKDDQNCKEPNVESSGNHWQGCSVGVCPSEGFCSGAETACSSFRPKHASSSSGAGDASADDGDGSNMERQESNRRIQFCFASGFEDKINFTFSASSSAQGSLSTTKRQHRKKSRMKVGHDTFIITPSPNVKAGSSSVKFSPSASTSPLADATQHQEDLSTSRSKEWNMSEAGDKQGSISSAAAIQEACEMWRFRGNQAYKNGGLSKAEDFYTQGINTVPSSETLGCRVKPLVLCYSNRAATRVSLGRMREAIGDCVMAAALDPNFIKVHVRAANCHLVLGEVEDARLYFNKCLNSGADVCLDRRVTIEAADGLQKAQKVAECINRSAKLLEQKTSDAALSALEIIAEALSISSCSEKLLEMKAEALCLLRKYEEAIKLCEQTLPVAEMNFASVRTGNQLVNMDASGHENCSLASLWRWRLISKSYFYMGRLEMALDLLQKLEQAGSIRDKCGSEILESSISLATTIRELLHRKNAGNEAVQSRRYAEAVEHYTVALSSNVESRPFAAICFCNRAAAHQALGQIVDAIADCSLAMALEGNYAKAVSRRAALHEMIRDYGQAASDLQRLISILENQSDEKAKQFSTPGRSTGSIKELRQAHRHLSSMEEAAKKDIPLDFYLILGIKPSDTASDIKKAYRKAALRHHPDKAGQFLARSESGDEGRLWKEIAQDVHKDADRLFKMIGEAHAVLSDTTKRSEYDFEEEIRKVPKESSGSSTYRRPSDVHGYPFERSANRRNWQDHWKTYGKSESRW